MLRANTDGSTVRLKDVARVELGGQSYATSARLNGVPAVGVGVQPTPTGNALRSAKAVRAKMVELERYFPKGVKWNIPLRQLALRADLDHRSGEDAVRGRRAGVRW